MGCASSSLDRQYSLRRSRTPEHGHHQKQAISVVGILVKRDSLRVIGREPDTIPRSLYKKVKGLGHGKKPLLQDKGADKFLGNPNLGDISVDSAEADGLFASVHLLESPRKLCPEQERRLRCANMEVPATGLIDFSSDDDDDEGDGFEFAKLEDTVNSEQGPLWTPITSFNSEQGTKKVVPLHGALLDSPEHQASTAEGEKGEKRYDCSISEPELEVLISPQYTDLPENHSLPVSPQSVALSQVSPSSPLLERFSSNSMNRFSRLSFTSEESLLFPGFTARDGFDENGSVSPSVASLAGSVMDWSLENVPIGISASIDTGKWGSSPSWTWTSPTNSPSARELLDGHHTFRWDSPPSYWDNPSPAKALHMQFNENHSGALIPGLSNDLAQLCLMRVPFIKYNHSLRLVCQQWRTVISSEEFFKTRSALGIHEAHISFVVHGNRVQIFSLQAHQWFCLPPLPRGDGSISPEWRLSPEWGLSPPSTWSSPEGRGGGASDFGIDPYDWWQINTLAGLDGTLFVIGGDQADIRSFMQPSKPTNTVHKYDCCRGCWVAVSPMQVLRSHAAAVSLGNLLYVTGGNEDVEEGASAEVYDVKLNKWSPIPRMNMSMRTCVGMNHEGCIYVKGESSGPGCHVEGETYNLSEGRWNRMHPGMRKGLERGPVASCNSEIFVADWKDSLLKVYEFRTDSWLVISKLPAKISRLVGHLMQLYALTGKIKVDPYNHHVISDAPAEVWRLDLRKVMGRFTTVKGSLQETTLLQELDGDGVYGKFAGPSDGDGDWDCLWRDPKQMAKTGLAWVPCIAHCTLFED